MRAQQVARWVASEPAIDVTAFDENFLKKVPVAKLKPVFVDLFAKFSPWTAMTLTGKNSDFSGRCDMMLEQDQIVPVSIAVQKKAVALRRCSGPSRARSRDGGRFRLIALIEEAAVIERILRHLRLPPEIPAPPPRVVEPLERQALARNAASAACERVAAEGSMGASVQLTRPIRRIRSHLRSRATSQPSPNRSRYCSMSSLGACSGKCGA